MANLGKTWWGQRFIEALERFTDSGRLQRGRGYSGDNRILAFGIADGLVTATVRGKVNPYFGVYKEPRYTTRIRMAPIPAKDWAKAIAHIGSNAALVSRLLMNEMPDNIDDAFAGVKLHLLPRSRKDFALTDCSCPDYANPCKHIAGVYYRLAHRLDSDPFLLFELRGLSRERLRKVLSITPLGKALATLVVEEAADLAAADAFYTRPVAALNDHGALATPDNVSRRRSDRLLHADPLSEGEGDKERAQRNAHDEASDYHSFWNGKRRLPSEIEPCLPAAVPAILIKKGGDYPAFWDKSGSFIAVMEELYLRVREKNKDVL